MKYLIASPGSIVPEDNLRPLRLLNVGCGSNIHPDWINVDVAPAAADVLAVDLRRELPFPAASFDAVYCAHVLEHFSRGAAGALLARLFRVLRPGGLLRIAVPDLEAIVREYLRLLDEQQSGGDREADYDWILLELYDQAVRDTSGGDMAKALAAAALPNRDYVRRRIGAEAEAYWDGDRSGRRRGPLDLSDLGRWHRLLARARMRLAGMAAAAIGGRDAGEALAEGAFRRSGEVHRWMYDAYSLGRALRRAGFVNVTRQSASESRLSNFATFRLEADEQGCERKPDSLYMEAERPAGGGGSACLRNRGRRAIE